VVAEAEEEVRMAGARARSMSAMPLSRSSLEVREEAPVAVTGEMRATWVAPLQLNIAHCCLAELSGQLAVVRVVEVVPAGEVVDWAGHQSFWYASPSPLPGRSMLVAGLVQDPQEMELERAEVEAEATSYSPPQVILRAPARSIPRADPAEGATGTLPVEREVPAVADGVLKSLFHEPATESVWTMAIETCQRRVTNDKGKS